jgi:hypothetical protein
LPTINALRFLTAHKNLLFKNLELEFAPLYGICDRMPGSRKDKLLLIDWVASPGGPGNYYFLRNFSPTLPSQLYLVLRNWRHKRWVSPFQYSTLKLCPPGSAKMAALRQYGRRFRPKIFVETGTHVGNTTLNMSKHFARCVTIELSNELHARALKLFESIANVTCLHGNSGVVIKDILKTLDEPALFWLDAHHSGGETAGAGYDPIFEELGAIYSHKIKNHIILIDDARGHRFKQIQENVPSSHQFVIKNDIIRILPR